MSMRTLIRSILPVVLLSCHAAAAADYDLSQQLVPPEAAAGDPAAANDDHFGQKVSISGRLAVVGSPLERVDGDARRGSVHVYAYREGEWRHEVRLVRAGAVAGEMLGTAVAIAGDAAAALTFSNVLVIWERAADGTWTERAQLTPQPGQGAFVRTLAAGSGRFAAGAYRASDGVAVVNVYRRGDAGWAHEATLESAGASPRGGLVSMHGATIAIGAPYHGPGLDLGLVEIFEPAPTWRATATIRADGPDPSFGTRLALGDATLVVASGNARPAEGEYGHVHIYTRSGTGWTRALVARGTPARYGLGETVALGDADAFASDIAGNIEHYRRDIEGRWGYGGTLRPGALPGGHGDEMSASGTTLITGAPGAIVDGVMTGAAYLYGRPGEDAVFADGFEDRAP